MVLIFKVWIINHLNHQWPDECTNACIAYVAQVGKTKPRETTTTNSNENEKLDEMNFLFHIKLVGRWITMQLIVDWFDRQVALWLSWRRLATLFLCNVHATLADKLVMAYPPTTTHRQSGKSIYIYISVYPYIRSPIGCKFTKHIDIELIRAAMCMCIV